MKANATSNKIPGSSSPCFSTSLVSAAFNCPQQSCNYFDTARRADQISWLAPPETWMCLLDPLTKPLTRVKFFGAWMRAIG